MGSGVGVFRLSGRKMVLKPCPLKVPVKAARGPRLGADEVVALNAVRLDTYLISKLLRSEKADSSLVSLICIPHVSANTPNHSRFETMACWRRSTI